MKETEVCRVCRVASGVLAGTWLGPSLVAPEPTWSITSWDLWSIDKSLWPSGVNLWTWIPTGGSENDTRMKLERCISMDEDFPADWEITA